MHGRLKVRTTAEQQEAKRKEREKKLQIYNAATSKALAKYRAEELDVDGLTITRPILEANPDFYTLWNFRKQILLHLLQNSLTEEAQKTFEEELHFLEVCLKVNPKSYGTWNHRCFVLDNMPQPNWNHELQLCNQFLSFDDRNFHCWGYRRFIVGRAKVSLEDEFKFTMKKIEESFSNYSSWHYRSKLLPLVHPDPSRPQGVTEEAMNNEYDMFQQAVFTDPYDQSAWIYHRWLLGRGKKQQQILHLYCCRKQDQVIVSLCNHVKIDGKDQLLMKVNEEARMCTWLNQHSKKTFSTLWISDNLHLPSSGPLTIKVTLIHDGQEVCSESVTLHEADMNNYISATISGSLFSLELSAVERNILEAQLGVIEDLNQEEKGENKWALLSIIVLKKALGSLKFEADILGHIDELILVDSMRTAYYKDLRSRFVMENALERLPAGSRSLRVRGQGLTAVYHKGLFPCLTELDLSNNSLRSVGDLACLRCLQRLQLDSNQLSSCQGIAGLSFLVELSLQENMITNAEDFSALRHCVNLTQLDIQKNPVCQDPTLLDKLLEILPGVKVVTE